MTLLKVNFVLLLGLLEYFVFSFFGIEMLGIFIFAVLLLIWRDLKLMSFVVLGLIALRLVLFVWYPLDHVKCLNDSGKFLQVEGSVVLEPDLRREDVRYYLGDLMVEGEARKGRLLFKANLYPRFEYGDRLKVKGFLETPFEEDEFSYKNYLRIFRTDSLLKLKGGVYKIGEDSSFFRELFRFKNWFLKILEYRLMEPYSSLVAGLVLGVRKGFSDEVMNQFNRTGLTHIIAVSGYNVSMIIVLISGMLGWVPRQVRFYAIGVFLFLFMIITGASAAVIRAVVMGVIALMALEFGRVQFLSRTLLLTILLMGFWNPAYILYDVGSQLSFLSTVGVVYLSPLLKFKWLPETGGIREAFVLTIAAQLATMPIMIYKFGRISLISPLANLLVAPFLPLSMFFGFLTFLLAWIPGVVQICVFFTSISSFLLFRVVEYCSELSWASVEFGHLKFWLWVYLVGFGLFLWVKRKLFLE